MPRLDSSAIRKVTYNPKTEKMNVQFVGKGKQYTYVGVPEDVYRDFVNAPSAGKFFNDNIKDDYIAVPSEFVGSVRFDTPDDEDFYEERNMSGQELNELFGFGKIEPDPRLVKIFKKQISDNLVTKQTAVMDRIRSRSRGRLPKDPDIIDHTFREPVPQTLSRKIGEEISESKSVLREFQAMRGAGGGGAVRIGGLSGASVGRGRVPLTGKNINPNIRMGLDYLYKNLGGVAGVMGKPPQTPGGGDGSGGGSGGGSGKRNILWKIAQVLGIPLSFLAGKIAGGAAAVFTIYEILKRIYNKAIDSLPLSEEHKKWLKANMGIVIGAIAITAGSIEAARRLTPRLMKVLRNRRISAEIGEALDAGDETMARTILLDAIEDENINLSAIRRKLGDDDYERLYRDYL
jgi:hypothetical protein